jgi:hypothetical protein
MECKHSQLPRKKTFKCQPSAGKLRLTVFWDSQGPLPERYQERDTIIKRARYGEMLTDRLGPAIRSKRRGILSKGVVAWHWPSRILLPTLLKPYGNSSFMYVVIVHPPIVPTQPLLSLVWSRQRGIKGPLIHLEPRSGGSGGSLFRRKFYFLKAYRGFCSHGLSALKSKGTMLKNNVNVKFSLFLWGASCCVAYV